jgi:V/A-type H+-transporting ATPase subunit E
MEGLERIKERIIEEAQAKKNKILEEAKARTEKLKLDYEKRREEIKEQALSKAERLAEEEKRKIISMAELEERKRLLDAKQKIIDMVFDESQKLIQNMSDSAYEKLIRQLLLDGAVSGEEEIIMSDSSISRLSPNFLHSVNEELIKRGKLGKLKLSDETRPMQGGFILKSKDLEINCTFDSIIKLQREELETDIAKILFEE